MDCVKDKNQDLCQQESVKAYPTFHYYHYGKLLEKYESDRTVSGGGPGSSHCRGREREVGGSLRHQLGHARHAYNMGPIFTLLGAWGLMSQSTVPPCGSAQELVEVWGGGQEGVHHSGV